MIRSIDAMVDELPKLADDWPTLSRGEQLSWSHDWDNEMSKLSRLAEMDAAGQLDRDQQQQFRALAEQAVKILPRIEEINYQRPDEIVLEAGRARVSS